VSFRKDIQELFEKHLIEDLEFYIENPSYALLLSLSNIPKADKYNILSFSVKKEGNKIFLYISFIIRGAKRTIKAGRINMLYEVHFDDELEDRIRIECERPNGGVQLESCWKESAIS